MRILNEVQIREHLKALRQQAYSNDLVVEYLAETLAIIKLSNGVGLFPPQTMLQILAEFTALLAGIAATKSNTIN